MFFKIQGLTGGVFSPPFSKMRRHQKRESKVEILYNERVVRDPLQQLFQSLWSSYERENFQVPKIHRLIADREGTEVLANDHIALRTFQHKSVGLQVLARVFLDLGFVEKDTYRLRDKHVFAKYYTHPSGKWPRVFISELELGALSKSSRKIIDGLIAQIPKKLLNSPGLVSCGRVWQLSHKDYRELLHESEYASWMAAHGFRMNHATLSVNAMKTFSNLESLVAFLQEKGFVMNGAKEGQVIQTARDATDHILLEQASTIATRIRVSFIDGDHEVPGCYYEFIQRFHDYDGFDSGNATKIMESTRA